MNLFNVNKYILLYTLSFFTLLAYTPLILGLGALQIGPVFFSWGLLLIVGSAVLSSSLNRQFGMPEATGGTLAVFEGIGDDVALKREYNSPHSSSSVNSSMKF